MTLKYDFEDEDTTYEYEYEVEPSDIDKFIEDNYDKDELIDLYIKNIYNKDAVERSSLYDDFGISSATELRDFYFNSDSEDWVIEAILDNIPEYFEDDMKEYFYDDAYEEFMSTDSIEDVHDEWMSDYWNSRL